MCIRDRSKPELLSEPHVVGSQMSRRYVRLRHSHSPVSHHVQDQYPQSKNTDFNIGLHFVLINSKSLQEQIIHLKNHSTPAEQPISPSKLQGNYFHPLASSSKLWGNNLHSVFLNAESKLNEFIGLLHDAHSMIHKVPGHIACTTCGSETASNVMIARGTSYQQTAASPKKYSPCRQLQHGDHGLCVQGRVMGESSKLTLEGGENKQEYTRSGGVSNCTMSYTTCNSCSYGS